MDIYDISTKLIFWEEEWRGFRNHILNPKSFIIDYDIHDMEYSGGKKINFRHETWRNLEEYNAHVLKIKDKIPIQSWDILGEDSYLEEELENLEKNYDSILYNGSQEETRKARRTLERSVGRIIGLIENIREDV